MMKEPPVNNTGDLIAKVISTIFHPLFIPLYGMILILSAPTLIGYIPFTVKKILVLIILINNVVIPLSLLPFFRYRQIISSWSMENRKERNMPLLTASFFYATTVYMIYRLQIPHFIKAFIIATAFLSIIVTVINFWSKISVHGVSTGMMIGLVILLSIKMQVPLTWYVNGTVLTGGLVLTSRLWLKAHTQWELWSGFFLGVIGSSAVMLIIK